MADISVDNAVIGANIGSSVLAIKATPDTLDLVESRTTSLGNTASPVVTGTDQNASVNSTVFAVDSKTTTMTLVESQTTSIGNTVVPVVAGTDQNANVNSTVVASITYAYTDSIPIVVYTPGGTTINVQNWTMG